MSYTYNLDTDIGIIRLVVPDRVNTADEPAIFSDEEIQAFLDLEDGVRRAAAACLETIASDQALVLKVMKVQNITTDGPKVSAELRSRAKDLRQQAHNDEADNGELFDIAELVYNNFSARERIWKQAQRQLLT